MRVDRKRSDYGQNDAIDPSATSAGHSTHWCLLDCRRANVSAQMPGKAMRRRTFITLFGGVFLGLPITARAQEAVSISVPDVVPRTVW